MWEEIRWRVVCTPSVMAGVRHYRDLECWQLARSLKVRIFTFTGRRPASGDFEYVRQIRDAARSGPRNIAEGFGRRTHADFARFLDVARASLMECQNHLDDAVDSEYLGRAEANEMIVLAKRAGGAVAALQRYLRNHPDP